MIAAHPEVLNHNVETVKELQACRAARRRGYERSLGVLRYCKEQDPTLLTKTGFMVGLGETEEQIDRLMDDILETGCDILTIGQYLQPSPAALPAGAVCHAGGLRPLEGTGVGQGLPPCGVRAAGPQLLQGVGGAGGRA